MFIENGKFYYTVVEISWLEDDEVKSMKFNLDEFLASIVMKNYRPYKVIEFMDKKIKTYYIRRRTNK